MTQNAIIFTMCNCNNNRLEISEDTLKYYTHTLRVPKSNIYLVDSGNLGLENLIDFDHQHIFDQDLIEHSFDDNTEYITNAELYSLISLTNTIDLSNFNYVFKLTCKYKLPEINQILNYTSDKDILVQNSGCELIGFKSTKIINILNMLNEISVINLETKLDTLLNKNFFSSEKLPQYKNIATYNRSNGDYKKYL